MKHYLVFILLIILLIFSYIISPYFAYNKSLSVPAITVINLPKFTKIKQYAKSDINVDAFMRKNVRSASSALYSQREKIALEMIYFDGNSKICKLNGEYFREGESRSGIKVLKIKKRSVLIKVNKKIERLKLGVAANEKS